MINQKKTPADSIPVDLGPMVLMALTLSAGLFSKRSITRSQIREHHRPLVRLTGASGYIGSRLLEARNKVGWPFAASLDDLIVSGRELLLAWELSQLIAQIRGSLRPKWLGCTPRYYLVHHLGSPRSGTWQVLCSPPESPLSSWPRSSFVAITAT